LSNEPMKVRGDVGGAVHASSNSMVTDSPPPQSAITLAVPVSASVPDVIGYARVSTESQAVEDKSSLADQRAAISALAARLGRTLDPAHVFEDAGASGQTADRPGFMRLLAYCADHARPRHNPGLILVLNDSRFGRFADPEDATYWRVELKKRGWLVRFVENDDTEDSLTRNVLRAIHSAQASAYVQAVKANAQRGARGTAAQGYWQNEAPLGYRRVATGPSGTRVLQPGQRKADDEKVRLGLGPEREHEIVRWMFERYASGEVSLGMLVHELAQRLPERRWSRGTVGAILRNPAYAGDVVWCRRPHDKMERQERPTRSREEWVIKPDAHAAVVSHDLFAAVQARLALNKRQTRAVAGTYALTGLMHCAHCGRPYIGGGGPKGPPGDPRRYRFYKDSGECAAEGYLGTLQQRIIEPRVVRAIADVVRQPAIQHAIVEALDEALGRATEDQHNELRLNQVELERLRKERERLIAAVASGILRGDEVRDHMAAVRQRLDAVTANIEQLRFAERQHTALASEREQMLRLATDFPALARKLSGPALRELVRPWLQDALVDKERRTVTMTIRRVPAASTFVLLSGPPGRGSR
jgi:DNA invertase Pin-like site-specific DNA recombinase